MTVAAAVEPRIRWVPEYASSSGVEVIELCESVGFELDDWQKLILVDALGERDGKWAAFEVGMCVPRQNGKGGAFEARELGGLFVLGERFLVHSAHQFDTSLEAFRRLLFWVENSDDLRRRVKRVSRSHGEEGIELLSGQRIRFRTRTKGGGRGFTGDFLGLDEAMILPETAHGALLPTLSARPNPQVWYAGSAVDQLVHEDGVVFARVRDRGIRGGDQRLAYFEWSADATNEQGEPLAPDHVSDEVSGSLVAWEQANPGLGIRISPDHVESERRSMAARTFAVERLGVGDWPATDGTAFEVISVDAWKALTDPQSSIVGRPAFAFDVTPDRSAACIAAAGLRKDGLAHVEVIDYRRGTGWVADRVSELVRKHDAVGCACDAVGPAASLLDEIEGVEVTAVSARETANACGRLFDAVAQETVRHLGTAEMVSALRGAAKRQLGDAWAWSRRNSGVDISPLVAVTLAFWAAATLPADNPWVSAW